MPSMKPTVSKGGIVDHREKNAVNLVSAGDISWRRSRHCDGGACVEVAELGKMIALRESKDPDGPVITFGSDEWRTFVARIKSGTLELI